MNFRIWKGINFGLLGCLKINSCNGQIVTYSAGVDFEIAVQVRFNKITIIVIYTCNFNLNLYK